MRGSRRFGIYSTGKSKGVVSIYGAASEKITLTHDTKGTVFSATANSAGYAGELELPFGSYTVRGGKTGYSKTAIVDKYTSLVTACPDVTYFWHGLMMHGGWSGSGYDMGSGVTENSHWSVGTTLWVSTYDKYSNGNIGTINPVDLTGIDLVHFDVAGCTSAPDTYFAISTSKNIGSSAVRHTRTSSTGAHTVTFDVSALSGMYYLSFYTHVYDYAVTRTATVSAVRGTIDPAGTIRSLSQSIAVGDTYRYANSLIAGTWVRVSSLSFGSINYVGQGTEDYNAMMVPVSGFTYSGTFKKLKLALYLWTSSSSNRTFRWAVTTSTANAYAYQIGAGAVSDSYQVGQGTFTPDYSDSYQWHTIEMDCEDIPSGTPVYIYLWRNNTTYGNIHVMSSAVVTLQYEKG